MKTCVVSTRIPSGQAAGIYDILLPVGFGVPKGFVVYSLVNSSAYNAFDNGTAHVTRSVGFGGSVSTGANVVKSICHWQYSQYNVDPSNTFSSTAFTAAMYAQNTTAADSRLWWATSFSTDKIAGQYAVNGSVTGNVDMIFTVFGGDDVQCAVTGVGVTTTAIHNAPTPFQADVALMLYNRFAQTTDGELNTGICWRETGAGSGSTRVRKLVGITQRQQDNVATSSLSTVVQTRLSLLATGAALRPAYMGVSAIGCTLSGAATGGTVILLAIKGPTSDDFYVDHFIAPATGTGSSSYITGFVPQCVLGAFSGAGALDVAASTTANGSEMSSYFTATGSDPRNNNGLGTITTSTANATVTGSGTSFLYQIGPTDILLTTDGQSIGTVSSIASNTSITLTANSSLTLSAQNFVYVKSQQFAVGFGNLDGDSGTPNEFITGHVSTDALFTYTCSPGTATNDGNIGNMNGSLNGWTATMSTSTAGPDYGYYLAIKNQDYAKRRRIINT